MCKVLVRTVVVCAALAVCVSAAFAQQPAAKATFAFDRLVALKSCASLGATPDCSDPDTAEWQPILTQEIKVANAKDLFIDASLQCGIVTDTTVKSTLGSLDSAEARGTIRVKIEITDMNDNHVAWAQPNSGIDANGVNATEANVDGVVFCDRIQTLAAKFAGLECTTAPDGTVTCPPEELQLILKTLNANSFNFVAADLAQGVYKVVVRAKTSASVSATGTNGSLGKANAFIGAGSVAIESVRMIKGEQVEF